MCAPMEKAGRVREREEGRAQRKSGGPADPKGETLLAYMRPKRKGRGRAKRSSVAQLAAHRKLAEPSRRCRRRDGLMARREEDEGQTRSLGIQRCGMETLAPGFPMPAKPLLPL